MDNHGHPDDYEISVAESISSDVERFWLRVVRAAFVLGFGLGSGVVATIAIIAAMAVFYEVVMFGRKKNREMTKQLNRIEALLLRHFEIPRLEQREKSCRKVCEELRARPLTGTEQEIESLQSRRSYATRRLHEAEGEHQSAKDRARELECRS